VINIEASNRIRRTVVGRLGLWIGDSEFAIDFVQPTGIEQAFDSILGVGSLVRECLVGQ
jgi:hypothetical protein